MGVSLRVAHVLQPEARPQFRPVAAPAKSDANKKVTSRTR
jgi:hypothetical protein